MAFSKSAYLWSRKMLNFHFVKDICKTKLAKSTLCVTAERSHESHGNTLEWLVSKDPMGNLGKGS